MCKIPNAVTRNIQFSSETTMLCQLYNVIYYASSLNIHKMNCIGECSTVYMTYYVVHCKIKCIYVDNKLFIFLLKTKASSRDTQTSSRYIHTNRKKNFRVEQHKHTQTASAAVIPLFHLGRNLNSFE